MTLIDYFNKRKADNEKFSSNFNVAISESKRNKSQSTLPPQTQIFCCFHAFRGEFPTSEIDRALLKAIFIASAKQHSIHIVEAMSKLEKLIPRRTTKA